MSRGARLSFILGMVMIALGVAVALAPILAPIVIHRPSVTPSRWLDVIFAFFFIVRGVMNIRFAQRSAARNSIPR
jgi:threonine/homoserine/homoserine lactone efflux protein